MKFKYSMSLIPILAAELASGAMPENMISIEPRPSASRHNSRYVGVLDHWFFIGPSDDLRLAQSMRSQSMTVVNGQTFGVMMVLDPKPHARLMTMMLLVPSSPENFPCSTCAPGVLKIMPGKNVVQVVLPIESSKHYSGFRWGIDEKDPGGTYRIIFSIDGVIVDSYTFEVR